MPVRPLLRTLTLWLMLLVMPFQAFAAAGFVAGDEPHHSHEVLQHIGEGHDTPSGTAMHGEHLRGAAHHVGHHAGGVDRTCGCSACWPPIVSSTSFVVPRPAEGSRAIAFAAPYVYGVVPAVLERPPRLPA